MPDRRSFFRSTAGVVTGGLAAGAVTSDVHARTRNDDMVHEHGRLIRVGALTSGHHHHLFHIWGPMIQSGSPERNGSSPYERSFVDACLGCE